MFSCTTNKGHERLFDNIQKCLYEVICTYKGRFILRLSGKVLKIYSRSNLIFRGLTFDFFFSSDHFICKLKGDFRYSTEQKYNSLKNIDRRPLVKMGFNFKISCRNRDSISIKKITL